MRVHCSSFCMFFREFIESLVQPVLQNCLRMSIGQMAWGRKHRMFKDVSPLPSTGRFCCHDKTRGIPAGRGADPVYRTLHPSRMKGHRAHALHKRAAKCRPGPCTDSAAMQKSNCLTASLLRPHCFIAKVPSLRQPFHS